MVVDAAAQDENADSLQSPRSPRRKSAGAARHRALSRASRFAPTPDDAAPGSAKRGRQHGRSDRAVLTTIVFRYVDEARQSGEALGDHRVLARLLACLPLSPVSLRSVSGAAVVPQGDRGIQRAADLLKVDVRSRGGGWKPP